MEIVFTVLCQILKLFIVRILTSLPRDSNVKIFNKPTVVRRHFFNSLNSAA